MVCLAAQDQALAVAQLCARPCGQEKQEANPQA